MTTRCLLHFFVAVLAASVCAAAELGPSPGELGSDHAALACDECHDREAGGVSCGECHPNPTHIHPVSVEPSFPIPSDFPTVRGAVDCVSCHGAHSPDRYKHLRGVPAGGDQNLEGFCSSCHGGGMTIKNPHEAAQGADRCALCHDAIDVDAVLSGQRPGLRAETGRLCNFCHDVRGKGHPKNVDPTLGIPQDLPRLADGTVGCQTCHEPHGSVNYTHYIREPYGRHFEQAKAENPHFADYFACPSCHAEPAAHRITAENHDLRFQNDSIMLCISCHSRSRSHHPVGVSMGLEMNRRMMGMGGLPMDGRGRITCITCHSNNCENDAQQMVMRHYGSNPPDFTLCWYCHDKESLQKVNPHEDDLDARADRCLTCHDRPPLKGVQESGNLYFVSRVQMLCLRCHEDIREEDLTHSQFTPSPDMLVRIRAMEEEMNIEIPLEVDGSMTCTTCHNAHFSGDVRLKTRLPYDYMCANCHNW